GSPMAELSALRGMLATRTVSGEDGCALLMTAAEESDDPDRGVTYLADAVSDCFYAADGAAARVLAARLETTLDRVTSSTSVALGRMALGIARILAGIDGGREEVAAASRFLADDPAKVDEFLGRGPLAIGNPHRLCWLLLGPMFLRDVEVGQLRDVAGRLRDDAALGVLPSLLFQMARDQATSDRWSHAQATYTDAIRFARESGETRDLVMSLSGLAWLDARCGHDESSRACVEQARTADPTGRVLHARMWQMFAAGERDLVAGRAAEAADHFGRLDARQGEVDFLDVDMSPDPERVESLCRLERIDEAREIASAYAARAAAKGQPWALARSERALALTGPDDELDTHLETALGLHAETLDGFETARTRLVVGERLRRARRRKDAREQLREAVAIFDQLGAAPWAERAAAELAATGETAHRRHAGAAESLTPQELQVATLLTDGHTTREAATALFLSPKTVEYHLRKAYLKLGVNSREALARALSE
ncbi:MAG TPA: helix-turn-helix transcriptional regulator, partial [Nocardioides sp.]|nr:helix-turn-helix transcriptional regulator [Nocardioides sp.]